MNLTVLNPATEEPITELEQAGVEQADEAVARAKGAYPAWGRFTGRIDAAFCDGWRRRSRTTPRSSLGSSR